MAKAVAVVIGGQTIYMELGESVSTAVRDRRSAIDHFVDRASRNPRVVGYTKADHGHGVIQI